MTISDQDREALIKYRIEEAHEAMEDVQVALDNNKLKMAVNRIYYGMYEGGQPSMLSI